MHRRHVDEGLGANPFVVLVDITIAVAFFLVVFAISATLNSSQSLVQMTRQERQKRIRDQLAATLQRYFPNSQVKPFDVALRTQIVVDPAGRRLAQIFENASYQRVSILVPMFEPGTANPTPQAARIWSGLGAVVAHNWGQLDYLQLHGIVGPSEQASKEGALETSRSRADAALKILQDQGTVSKAGNGQRGIPLKYVVAFGTGSELYANLKNNNRVDLVLFFPDDSRGIG